MFHCVMGQNNIECTVGEACIPIDALDHVFQPEDLLGTQAGPCVRFYAGSLGAQQAHQGTHNPFSTSRVEKGQAGERFDEAAAQIGNRRGFCFDPIIGVGSGKYRFAADLV